MSLLVVGTIAFDTVKTPFAEKSNILAGAATYFSIAASFFTDVKVVGVVGDDFKSEHEAVFNSRNIDISQVEHKPGKSFSWSGEYGYDFNTRTTLDTQLNVFENYSPKLSPEMTETSYLFLGNAHPDLQREVRKQSKSKLVGMDTMDFWISGTPESLQKTLAEVDLLIINDEEARQLGQDPNLIRAAKKILLMGPKQLIVKRGEYGAALFGENSYFVIPGYPQEEVIDPTGAGDTFAGGVMGYLAATNGMDDEVSIRRAMIYGSVMASFNIEAFGSERLMNLTYKEINERFLRFKHFTHFEDNAHQF